MLIIMGRNQKDS